MKDCDLSSEPQDQPASNKMKIEATAHALQRQFHFSMTGVDGCPPVLTGLAMEQKTEAFGGRQIRAAVNLSQKTRGMDGIPEEFLHPGQRPLQRFRLQFSAQRYITIAQLTPQIGRDPMHI